MRPPLIALAVLVALSGCSSVQRSSDHGRDADRRPRRADARAAPDRDRIRRDVRDYVGTLDRVLRLDDRDERQIRRLLEDRTDDLARDRRRAYPFPRRLDRARSSGRDVEAFWRDADAAIERLLDRGQAREYRELTGRSGRRGHRGRRN